MYLSTKKNKKKLISQKDGFSTLQVVRYQFLPRIKQAVHSLLGLLVTSRGSRQKNEKNVFVQKTLSEVKASVEDLDLSKQ